MHKVVIALINRVGVELSSTLFLSSDNNNIIYYMTLWFRDLGKHLLGDSSTLLGVNWDTQCYAPGAWSGVGSLLTCLGP